MTDIVIIGGCGHVGLPLGPAFDRAGQKVVAIGIDAGKVSQVDAGRMPFKDRGADGLHARGGSSIASNDRNGQGSS